MLCNCIVYRIQLRIAPIYCIFHSLCYSVLPAGVPSIIRSDLGTENSIIASISFYIDMEETVFVQQTLDMDTQCRIRYI